MKYIEKKVSSRSNFKKQLRKSTTESNNFVFKGEKDKIFSCFSFYKTNFSGISGIVQKCLISQNVVYF